MEYIKRKTPQIQRNVLFFTYSGGMAKSKAYMIENMIKAMRLSCSVIYSFTFMCDNYDFLPNDIYDTADVILYNADELTSSNNNNLSENELLLNYLPDIILHFVSPPFMYDYLKIRYPHSLLFAVDSAIFTRVPYPSMQILDPVGVPYTFLNKYWSQIEPAFSLSDKQKQSLMTLKQRLREIVAKLSPFKEVIESYKNVKNLSSVLLLPLSVNKPIGYNNYITFVDEVLKHTNKQTGVIVTFHPLNREAIKKEDIDYLSKNHPHLIFDYFINDYPFASQYLLAHTDGVVSGNLSSLIVQASLIWNTKTLCTDPAMQFCNDEKELSLINKMLSDSQNKERASLLYWILLKYSFFNSEECYGNDYLYNSAFLTEFLEHSLSCYRNDDMINFYNDIDSYDVYFDKIISFVTNGIEVRTNDVYPATKSQYELLALYTLNLQNGIEINAHPDLSGKEILIYGMGIPGKTVYNDLRKKDGVNYKLTGTLDPDSLLKYKVKGNECVIITPVYDFDIIKERLINKGFTDIVNLEELIHSSRQIFLTTN